MHHKQAGAPEDYIKQYTHQHIRKQINTWPKGTPNTKITPKKCGGEFGIKVTEQLKKDGLKFNKFDLGHFNKKNYVLDKVDIADVPIRMPLRSSTPTSDLNSTVLAAVWGMKMKVWT